MIHPISKRVVTTICTLLAATAAFPTTTSASHTTTPTSAALFQKALSSLPSCPLGNTFPIQHTDAACNRAHSNSHQVRMLRKKPPHLVGVSGGEAVSRLAEEATWICPDNDNNILKDDDDEDHIIGHMTTWLLKNEATTPISIAYVDKSRNNLEVSAKNGHIYPAHVDPHSILYPGEWTSIHTFQGHLFHVRELVDVGGGIVSPGRILVRHRPGLIPIGEGENVHCPISALQDLNPALQKEQNAYERTKENTNEHCNVLHRGFINKVKCPVDIYFAGSVAAGTPTPSNTVQQQQQQQQDSTNHNTTSSSPPTTITCKETFKMHLGINPSPQNYLDDWDSPIKFEGSYLYHRFVARMRHDPNIVVGEVVMEPFVVRDCPFKRKEGGSRVMEEEKEREEVGVMMKKKSGDLDEYVPRMDRSFGNLTVDMYRQMGGGGGGGGVNITAMATVDADEIGMVMLEEYVSDKVVAVVQS